MPRAAKKILVADTPEQLEDILRSIAQSPRGPQATQAQAPREDDNTAPPMPLGPKPAEAAPPARPPKPDLPPDPLREKERKEREERENPEPAKEEDPIDDEDDDGFPNPDPIDENDDDEGEDEDEDKETEAPPSPPPADIPADPHGVGTSASSPHIQRYQSRIHIVDAWKYPGSLTDHPDFVDPGWASWAEYDEVAKLEPGPALRVPTSGPQVEKLARKGDYVVRQMVTIDHAVPADMQLDVWSAREFERLFIPG